MTIARGSSARKLLAVGAMVTVVGLAVAAVAPIPGTAGSERTGVQELVGGGMVLVGWAVLAWGVHRFGRGSWGAPSSKDEQRTENRERE